MKDADHIFATAFAAWLADLVKPLLEEHRAAVRADVRKALAELRADEEGPDQAAFDTRGAAVYIGVSERTIARMRSDGRLPAVRVGRQMRFRREDLDRYLSANMETK